MVKVYAVVLVLGIVGLVVYIMGGALAESREGEAGETRSFLRKEMIAAALGFGMGGMSAEFSPFDLSWPIALIIALGAAGLSVAWVRYAATPTTGR